MLSEKGLNAQWKSFPGLTFSLASPPLIEKVAFD